jgi:hypothetical protein
VGGDDVRCGSAILYTVMKPLPKNVFKNYFRLKADSTMILFLPYLKTQRQTHAHTVSVRQLTYHSNSVALPVTHCPGRAVNGRSTWRLACIHPGAPPPHLRHATCWHGWYKFWVISFPERLADKIYCSFVNLLYKIVPFLLRVCHLQSPQI